MGNKKPVQADERKYLDGDKRGAKKRQGAKPKKKSQSKYKRR